MFWSILPSEMGKLKKDDVAHEGIEPATFALLAKRAGPITQRSEDRNLALLCGTIASANLFFLLFQVFLKTM